MSLNNNLQRIASFSFSSYIFLILASWFKYTFSCSSIIEKPEDGYYVINPGKDLSKMEEKMCDFISSRVPSWDGIAGSFPPDKEFAAALKNHSFLL